jgi:hypothetical protein
VDLVVGAGPAAERPCRRGRPVEGLVRCDHRERVPVGVEAGVGDVEVGPEVVLEEVVLVPPVQAQRRDLRRAAQALLVGHRVVELVPADAVLGAAGPLACVQKLAALVQVLADLQRLVDRQARDVPARPAGLPHVDVVAPVPDDRVVVAQHAEVVGRPPPPGVDVIHVVVDPVRGEGVLVERQVVGGLGAGVDGGCSGAVLGGEDQDVGVVGVLHHIEGDALGGLAAAAEPVPDGVPCLSPGVWPRR